MTTTERNGGANDPTDAHVAASAFSSTNGTYTYPADPAYANNAADLVELRLKPRTNEIVFRVTLNSLKDPARIGFTLAIGESAAGRANFPTAQTCAHRPRCF